MAKAKVVKNIKRLLNNKTVKQAIVALLQLEEEGHGDKIISVEAKITKDGYHWTPEASIKIVDKGN